MELCVECVYRIVLDKCCTIMMMYLYDLRFQYHLTIQWERFINVYTSKRILCIANHKKYVFIIKSSLFYRKTSKQTKTHRQDRNPWNPTETSISMHYTAIEIKRDWHALYNHTIKRPGMANRPGNEGVPGWWVCCLASRPAWAGGYPTPHRAGPSTGPPRPPPVASRWRAGSRAGLRDKEACLSCHSDMKNYFLGDFSNPIDINLWKIYIQVTFAWHKIPNILHIISYPILFTPYFTPYTLLFIYLI